MEDHFYYSPENQEKQDEFFKTLNREVNISYPDTTELYQWLRIDEMNKTISHAFDSGLIEKPRYRKKSDIKTMSSDYIIDNIEYAFKAWEFPWSKSYSFDVFCRYILPYRYGNEAPSPWRKIIYERFKTIADSLDNPNDPMEAAAHIDRQFRFVFSRAVNLSKYGIRPTVNNQLDANVNGNCGQQAGFGACVMRAMGIPTTVLKIPLSGTHWIGHELTAILDDENNWRQFNFGKFNSPTPLYQVVPKKFFIQFDKMKAYKPVLVDFSDKLMKVANIKVQVDAPTDDDVYLCVFGRSSWVPIWKGKNYGSEVVFENVGLKNVIYLAAKKRGKKLKAVAPLFLADTLGTIIYYKPEHPGLSAASLSRKSKIRDSHKKRMSSLINGKFYVSNDESFAVKELLHSIKDTVQYRFNLFKSAEKKGRFLKYEFPQSAEKNVDGPAEVAFYTTIDGELMKLEGRYFGSPQLTPNHINLMTDNDLLTYVEVWDCEKDVDMDTGRRVLNKDNCPVWIGMELDSTTIVTHVGICPRNDKNGIYAGMRYELFYWDDKWISLGKKLATGNSIRFEGIPDKAVLWLRNLDEGREERIFTLERGEQIWW